MVRVLQFGMSDNLGGMETYLLAQWRHLDRRKVQYDFVQMAHGDEPEIVFAEECARGGGRFYRVVQRHISPLKHYFCLFRLLWQHRKEYSCVVLNTCSMDYVFPMVAAALCGIPRRIMHSHNSGNEVSRSFVRNVMVKFNRILAHYAVTDFWACSHLAGRWMFRGEPYTIIHNAIDLAAFHYQPDVREAMRAELGLQGRFVVGNVARFSYQKNHTFLIDVFAALKKRIPEAILVLVGGTNHDSTYYDEVQRKIQKYGITDDVIFLGMRSDTAQLYQAFDVYVLPSHFEGLSVSALEAQAAGLTVVVSDALTEETKVTNAFFRLSLQAGPAVWADFIAQHRHDTRVDGAVSLREQGYDICQEAKRVEEFYSSLAKVESDEHEI